MVITEILRETGGVDPAEQGSDFFFFCDVVVEDSLLVRKVLIEDFLTGGITGRVEPQNIEFLRISLLVDNFGVVDGEVLADAEQIDGLRPFICTTALKICEAILNRVN